MFQARFVGHHVHVHLAQHDCEEAIRLPAGALI
jgi:hypothetical protein